jgi:hypothetical protein
VRSALDVFRSLRDGLSREGVNPAPNVFHEGQHDRIARIDEIERAHHDEILRPEAVLRSESALVYAPSLDREAWIASDPEEAAQLRNELAAEGDSRRSVILADDVVRLRAKPRELIDATVGALAVLGGTIVTVGPATLQHGAGDTQRAEEALERST